MILFGKERSLEEVRKPYITLSMVMYSDVLSALQALTKYEPHASILLTEMKELKKMNRNNSEPKIEEDKKVIDHPARYGGDTTYECIKVLQSWVSEEEYRGFLRCNAIKYLCRAGKKDELVQELKKSVWYINKLIESYERQDNETGN